MTIQDCTGASSHNTLDWNSINWVKCQREVERLQARIVKATQEGKQGKVKALQWMLTHSFSAKALAVKKVTENKGKKTSGIDNKIWSTPKNKTEGIQSLKRYGYQSLPLRRIYIPKSNGKMRPLGIPTMKDRAMQALYLQALSPIAETQADRCSYGFRPKRSTADAIENCFKVLSRSYDAEWVLEGDIKGCFDNISHDWMIANIPMDKVVLQKWLKAGFIDNKNLFPTEAGTPQGGIISPTLANITLDSLQDLLSKTFFRKRKNGRRVNPKVNFIRYADDFIITGCSKELLENEVKPLVEDFMKTRGLELSPEKTKITHINDGFDFLGQNIRKYGNKLLIKPSKKNVKTFLDNIRGIVSQNKAIKQVTLINILNPKIRGWANYHRHIVAKKTFNTVDAVIWRMLWRWAKRRHPDKGSHWIRKRYYKVIGNRNWVFSVDTDKEKRSVYWLQNACDTRIQRHTKIKSEANPFDPTWKDYFKKRELKSGNATNRVM